MSCHRRGFHPCNGISQPENLATNANAFGASQRQGSLTRNINRRVGTRSPMVLKIDNGGSVTLIVHWLFLASENFLHQLNALFLVPVGVMNFSFLQASPNIAQASRSGVLLRVRRKFAIECRGN